MTIKSETKLDPSKLLGFRNLVSVTAAGDDLLKASEQAFNKKGEGEIPDREFLLQTVP